MGKDYYGILGALRSLYAFSWGHNGGLTVISPGGAGVSKNASEDEVKKAYKKAAMKWHPGLLTLPTVCLFPLSFFPYRLTEHSHGTVDTLVQTSIPTTVSMLRTSSRRSQRFASQF